MQQNSQQLPFNVPPPPLMSSFTPIFLWNAHFPGAGSYSIFSRQVAGLLEV